MSQLISRIPLTIANGASLSDGGALGGRIPTIIMMPAEWTAAGLTFQGSHDGTTYYDLYDEDGTELTIPTSATRRIIISPTHFTDHKYLKVRSGTAATAIAQGAERIIYLEVWE
jgi:hypothetical protein